VPDRWKAPVGDCRRNRRERLRDGWRVVGVAALAQGVSVGSTFYAYGAFLKPLAAEFGASRLAVTLGLTFFTVVQGAIAPLLGRALDRGSPRAILIAGVVTQSAGLALLSRVSAFWQAGALFGTAIAVGSFLFGPLAAATVVAKRFVRRRGQALGVAALGAAVGGAVFPPVVTASIEALGWRGAVTAIAVGLLLLIGPFAWALARRPEEADRGTDGGPVPGPAPPAVASEPGAPVTTAALLRDRNFWAITMAIGFGFCPVSVLLAHLVPYATDLGIAPRHAAIAMSGYALGSGLGRVLFGALADRVDKRIVVWIAYASLALAWSRLLGDPSFASLLPAVVAAGVGMGGIAPLWGALTGATWGRAAFGRAMGLMNLLMLPFSIVGAPAAAHLFDRTGSYQLAFASFLGCFALGAIAIAFLRLPEHEPGSGPVEA